MNEQVVCESDAMSTGDLENLVLGVTVECSPLNAVGALLAEVEDSIFTVVRHSQLAASVCARKADDQAGELGGAARSINMRSELSGRTRVNLSESSSACVHVIG